MISRFFSFFIKYQRIIVNGLSLRYLKGRMAADHKKELPGIGIFYSPHHFNGPPRKPMPYLQLKMEGVNPIGIRSIL